MYFACLANAVAFGLLTAVATGGEIGTTEMLMVTAIGGVLFAIFSGQPLTSFGWHRSDRNFHRAALHGMQGTGNSIFAYLCLGWALVGAITGAVCVDGSLVT